MGTGISRQDIKFRQMFLAASGLYSGVIDGIYGSATETAYQSFQVITANIKGGSHFDLLSEQCICSLIPYAQQCCREFLGYVSILAQNGRSVRCRVISGTRTYAEQQSLYEQGRSKPGRIITNAMAGHSYHNFGIAWDIGIFDIAGNYLDHPDKYQEVASMIKEKMADKIMWGGDFERLRDYPHYQLKLDDLRIDSLRKKFESGTLIIAGR